MQRQDTLLLVETEPFQLRDDVIDTVAFGEHTMNRGGEAVWHGSFRIGAPERVRGLRLAGRRENVL